MADSRKKKKVEALSLSLSPHKRVGLCRLDKGISKGTCRN
jgi:hypothetical protein